MDNAGSRCGVVDAATSLRAGKQKNLARFPTEARKFSIFQSVHIRCGVYAALYPMSSEGVFTDEKWPWHEAELHPPLRHCCSLDVVAMFIGSRGEYSQ